MRGAEAHALNQMIQRRGKLANDRVAMLQRSVPPTVSRLRRRIGSGPTERATTNDVRTTDRDGGDGVRCSSVRRRLSERCEVRLYRDDGRDACTLLHTRAHRVRADDT